MNYRMFYTLHGICGILILLQVIFRVMWLPLHFCALLLSCHIIYRFRHCRWAHFECCIGVVIGYIVRLLLLYVFVNISLLWYVYYLFLMILGLSFLFIALKLFFC